MVLYQLKDGVKVSMIRKPNIFVHLLQYYGFDIKLELSPLNVLE